MTGRHVTILFLDENNLDSLEEWCGFCARTVTVYLIAAECLVFPVKILLN